MKKIKAIVYTSNTGYTERYAKLLGDKLELPAYSAKDAKKNVPKGSEILYFGWLMAGSVKGYPQAAKKYNILALCGVGMAEGGAQDEAVRKAYGLGIPVFTLQGGYDHNRVKGIYKVMMNTLYRMIGKKKDLTEQDRVMLEMIENGGDFVCEENLAPVMEWYQS